MILNKVVRVAEELKRVTKEARDASIINYFVDLQGRELFHVCDEEVYREILSSINKEPTIIDMDHDTFKFKYEIDYLGFTFTHYAVEKL